MKKNNADLTVSVMSIDWAEANRFGIMSVNSKDRIYFFVIHAHSPLLLPQSGQQAVWGGSAPV